MTVKCVDIIMPLAELMDELYEKKTPMSYRKIGSYIRQARAGVSPVSLVSRFRNYGTFEPVGEDVIEIIPYDYTDSNRRGSRDFVPPTLDEKKYPEARDRNAQTLGTRTGLGRTSVGYKNSVDFDPEECEYDVGTLEATPVSELNITNNVLLSIMEKLQINYLGHFTEITNSVLKMNGISPHVYDTALAELGISRNHKYDNKGRKFADTYKNRSKKNIDNVSKVPAGIGMKALKRIINYYNCTEEEAIDKYYAGERVKDGIPYSVAPINRK